MPSYVSVQMSNQKYADFATGTISALADGGVDQATIKVPKPEIVMKGREKHYKVVVLDEIVIAHSSSFKDDEDAITYEIVESPQTALLGVDDMKVLRAGKRYYDWTTSGAQLQDPYLRDKFTFPKPIVHDDTFYVTVQNDMGSAVNFQVRVYYHVEITKEEQLTLNILKGL
jgi:hypothetical protein